MGRPVIKINWKSSNDPEFLDKVDEWHESESAVPLHEYMGFDNFDEWIEFFASEVGGVVSD